ncbi:MAG: hypothetical protein ABIV51_13725 [Saprospiraceae bacterium]
MRNIIFCFLIFFISIEIQAQIRFENGYYIDNSNATVRGFIKNEDWKNNPNQFQFKSNENASPVTLDISNAKEFGIDGESKYVRSDIQIDRSSDDTDKMSESKQPEWSAERRFLKVILTGKAILYSYDEPSLKRYFFSTQDMPLEQLIFKRYKVDANNIATNNGFRQQLWVDLRCADTEMKNIEMIHYESRDLIKYFRAYSKCQGQPIAEFDKEPKRDFYNLKVSTGANLANLSFKNNIVEGDNLIFDTSIGVSLGLESEFIFPFNRNKWGLLFDPTFQYVKAQKQRGNTIASISYGSLEFPVGARYYSFLSPKLKLFVDGFYISNFSLNFKSKVNTGLKFSGAQTTLLDIKPRHSFAIGAGLEYKGMSAEMRYYTNRNLMSDNLYLKNNYTRVALIIGYKLIQSTK